MGKTKKLNASRSTSTSVEKGNLLGKKKNLPVILIQTNGQVPAGFSSDEVYQAFPNSVPNVFNRFKETIYTGLWW